VRELLNGLVAAFREAEALEELVSATASVLGIELAQHGDEGQVFVRRQLFIEARFLRGKAQSALGRLGFVPDIDPFDLPRPSSGG
jgi:hypothetical protein